jgi:hypothetical protein
MNQEVLPKITPVSGLAKVTQPAQSSQSAKPIQPVSTASGDRDALAGALPGWDLLPATPFVRRIK